MQGNITSDKVAFAQESVLTSRRETIGFTAAAFALAALELPQPASALGVRQVQLFC